MTHKPWPLTKAMMLSPLLVVWGVIFAAAYVRTIFTREPRQSEHDRFADGAIYSNNPKVDPLA